MRSISRFGLTVLAVLVPISGIVLAAEASSSGWFDMVNCEMCAPMMAEKGLMEHVKWESFSIATGMVNLCTVTANYEEAYSRANAKCTALGEKLMKGETLNLCGSCTAMGQLIQKGAKMDQLRAGGGHMMFLTATDPGLIDAIHTFRAKNEVEMAKMAQAK